MGEDERDQLFGAGIERKDPCTGRAKEDHILRGGVYGD